MAKSAMDSLARLFGETLPPSAYIALNVETRRPWCVRFKSHLWCPVFVEAYECLVALSDSGRAPKRGQAFKPEPLPFDELRTLALLDARVAGLVLARSNLTPIAYHWVRSVREIK